jgi:hypothetical protein
MVLTVVVVAVVERVVNTALMAHTTTATRLLDGVVDIMATQELLG